MDMEIPRIDAITGWLRGYLESTGAQGFVLGLSGGVDSAAAGALAARAADPEHVLGVLMPCHSMPQDAELGQRVADAFSIPTLMCNLTSAYDALIAALPPTEHPMAAANLKPRLRMSTLYYLAQSRHCLVLGASNRTEIMVGYFTKHGDSGVDLLPLGDLYKTEVWELARQLSVPDEVVTRPPTAGLWPGQTDEGEMGITYRELDRALTALEAGDAALAAAQIEPAVLQKVQQMVACSAHKRRMAPVFPVPGRAAWWV